MKNPSRSHLHINQTSFNIIANIVQYCITPLAWVEIQCFALTAYCLHAYMLTCLHAYMLTYLHVYVLACLHACMLERWHDSCLPPTSTAHMWGIFDFSLPPSQPASQPTNQRASYPARQTVPSLDPRHQHPTRLYPKQMFNATI